MSAAGRPEAETEAIGRGLGVDQEDQCPGTEQHQDAADQFVFVALPRCWLSCSSGEYVAVWPSEYTTTHWSSGPMV